MCFAHPASSRVNPDSARIRRFSYGDSLRPYSDVRRLHPVQSKISSSPFPCKPLSVEMWHSYAKILEAFWNSENVFRRVQLTLTSQTSGRASELTGVLDRFTVFIGGRRERSYVPLSLGQKEASRFYNLGKFRASLSRNTTDVLEIFSDSSWGQTTSSINCNFVHWYRDRVRRVCDVNFMASRSESTISSESRWSK